MHKFTDDKRYQLQSNEANDFQLKAETRLESTQFIVHPTSQRRTTWRLDRKFIYWTVAMEDRD